MFKKALFFLVFPLVLAGCMDSSVFTTPKITEGYWEGTIPGVSFEVKGNEIINFEGELFFSNALPLLPYCYVYPPEPLVIVDNGFEFRYRNPDGYLTWVWGKFINPQEVQGGYLLETCGKYKAVPPVTGTWFAKFRHQ